jgi:hypothetical protein
MPFTITQFKNAIKDGARPNLFAISFTTPNAQINLGDSNILCKAAAIPGFTLGVIEVPVQGGRRMKLVGDRTFAEWTATFIADSAHQIRIGFENWMNSIANSNFDSANRIVIPNLTSIPAAFDYKTNITVEQLDSTGKAMATYVLKDAFPTDVSQIDLSYDTTDAIEEFTVTFQYSHFV